MQKIILPRIGLLHLLLGFTVAGAFLFQAIEGPYEQREKSEIVKLRSQIIKNIEATPKGSSHKLRLSKELQRYEEELQEAFLSGINTPSSAKVWSFWGSMFYCVTVYTTIGYGNIAPATQAGRIATILYALVGIPLCLVVLNDIGKLLTRGLKKFWRIIKPDYTVNDEFNFSLVASVIVAFLFMALGSVMYAQWEEWDYFEALYFVFISISTIGFGDVLPEKPVYFLFSSIYLLVGLSLVSMVLNVITEAQTAWVEKTMGLSASLEEDQSKKKKQ